MTGICRWLLLGTLLALSSPVAAANCPLPGQKPILIARLYFGETIQGRKPLTDDEWRLFLLQIVTPRFPAGFTVYDAHGQWLDEGTHAVSGENTKVVEIAAQDTPAFRKNFDAVADAYRKEFRQESVGIVTTMACARF